MSCSWIVVNYMVFGKVTLVQLIDTPTRVATTSTTLLNLVITNNPDLVLDKFVFQM